MSINYKRDKNKIYLDRVMKPEDIDIIIECSKFRDSDSIGYYEKMKDDFEYRYYGNLVNMNQDYDKYQFACNFVNNDEEIFFIIRLGEIPIGELYTYEGLGEIYFNLILKKDYRNRGYGRQAVKELINSVFLYKLDFNKFNVLSFDTLENYDSIGDFIIKCGFVLDCEFASGARRLKYTEEMYNDLEMKEFKYVNENDYNEYVYQNDDTIFPKSFKRFKSLLNSDKKYNYVFWYQKDKLIGIGKYLKVNKIYKNCVWIEIKPKYRRKGYGTMFLNTMMLHLVSVEEFNDEYATITLVTKYNDSVSNKIIRRYLDKYISNELYWMGKIIYLIELIHVEEF